MNQPAIVGVDFVGGYSALVHKGFTRNESNFLDSIPEALSSTERLCGSVNAATTRAGINMDAVARVGRLIKDAAERTQRSGRAGLRQVRLFRQRRRRQSIHGRRIPWGRRT